EGSVKAEYRVNIYGFQIHNVTELLVGIKTNVIDRLANLTKKRYRQRNGIQNQIDTNGPCEFLVNPCGFGYECKRKENTGVCVDKCYSHPPPCTSGGSCYVDYKDNKTKCRCQDTDEYHYSGDRCEVQNRKVQAFSLTAKDYAIMAGSSAGAIMVILIIFFMIRILRKRYRKNK
ncbi:hypothetical protein ACJMK2_014510, partial [Sinanodonta woodiana]